MKRPQFFIDLERENAGEPEPEPERVDAQIHVQAVARVFYHPAAYQAQHAAITRYCQNAMIASEQRRYMESLARDQRQGIGGGFGPAGSVLNVFGGIFG